MRSFSQPGQLEKEDLSLPEADALTYPDRICIMTLRSPSLGPRLDSRSQVEKGHLWRVMAPNSENEFVHGLLGESRLTAHVEACWEEEGKKKIGISSFSNQEVGVLELLFIHGQDPFVLLLIHYWVPTWSHAQSQIVRAVCCVNLLCGPLLQFTYTLYASPVKSVYATLGSPHYLSSMSNKGDIQEAPVTTLAHYRPSAKYWFASLFKNLFPYRIAFFHIDWVHIRVLQDSPAKIIAVFEHSVPDGWLVLGHIVPPLQRKSWWKILYVHIKYICVYTHIYICIYIYTHIYTTYMHVHIKNIHMHVYIKNVRICWLYYITLVYAVSVYWGACVNIYTHSPFNIQV